MKKCSFLLSLLSLLLAAAPSVADVKSAKLPDSQFTRRDKGSIQAPPTAEPVREPSPDKPAPAAVAEDRKEVDFLKSRQEGVQITELGLMRATFVFEKGTAAGMETRVTEAFSNVDFRVFPSGVEIDGRIAPKDLHRIGNDRYADLVVYVKGSQREKPQKLGRLKLYETTVTAQVYNPMSEELLVSTTAVEDGQPHVDEMIAKRTSTEKACDAAVRETITKSLEKAHKVLVHEAQLKGVQDHQHLLEIMEYTARLKGVYHVRQCTYEKTSRLAVIEIISAPQTEVFWRAYMEKLPKREVLIKNDGSVHISKSDALRKTHPDWFEK
jgi:hypothetical protein